MSSYQDVNWGSNDSAPVTDNPLSLDDLDDYLCNHLGYRRLAAPPVDPYAPNQDYFHYWVGEGLDPISIACPQFRAKGYPGLVYDIDDVQHLIDRLDGHDEDGGDHGPDGHKLTAKRRDPS